MDTWNEFDLTKLKSWLQTGSINIFGLPFAGKDTQARKLGELLDIPVIAGGDILRSDPDQEKLKQLMSTGELIPTDLYLETVLPYFQQTEFDNKPLILSSVGRWKGEDEIVIAAAKESRHPIKAAILLRLDNDELWRRWKISQAKKSRGIRHDDDKHVLEVRLEEFAQKTIPVIEHYRHLGLLLEVDGHGEKDDVTRRILLQLSQFIN